HPPVLFIGYALTLVPFSYAIASFMKKDYHTWISRAFPWTLLALLMLSSGILLGGAWAYVSLTFGGFWSWDPVENSSLVPWMTLVAALHFMIISRRQNFALFSAYLLVTLSYVLVLYASFLTRSGVLADTSAHSFGDNGMTFQLLVFLLSFLVLMAVMIGAHVRKFHVPKKETLLSREFWMFIGGIIIVLASFQIIFTTSIPVYNTLFHTDIAPPTDRVGFYNRWQMLYALLIAGFIAFSQFLNYDSNDPLKFIRKLLIPLAGSFVLTIPFMITGIVTQWNFLFFLFFIFFALLSSINNLIFQTARPRNLPAIATHAGFIVFLLGTLLTFSNSTVISSNTSRFDLGDVKANDENLMLMHGDTLYLKGFYVVYTNKAKTGNTTSYRVDFLKKLSGKYTLDFSLHPSVNIHPRMGAVYNPDTKHFLNRDYYTYISSVGNDTDYIVIKTIMNPYINILWAGCILMTGGFGWAFFRRTRRRWVSR
ncbi:MAG: cytochrome c biogenesis protein CcsA, partial [Bacteroidota bacterium]